MKIQIEESALETMKIMVQKLQDDRDMLLATLRELRKTLRHANELSNGPINDTIWMMHRSETLFDFVDSAIAACTESKV